METVEDAVMENVKMAKIYCVRNRTYTVFSQHSLPLVTSGFNAYNFFFLREEGGAGLIREGVVRKGGLLDRELIREGGY